MRKETDFVRQCLVGFTKFVIFVGAAILAGGCPPSSPQDKPNGKFDFPLPPPPPRVPAAEQTPLDPALRQAARDRLVAGLQDTNELTQAHSLEAVGEVARYDKDGPDYSPYVIEALHSDSELVRFSAALTAGRLKMAAARPTLEGMLYDHSVKVCVGVRFALHMLGDTRHSHDLEKLSRDPDPTVRGAVAEVLGMMDEPSAVKILRFMRIDHDPRVIQEAAEALWRYGDEDGRDELIALTVSTHPDDAMFGLLALAEPRNIEIREHVRADLVSDYMEESLVAARAMGMLGSDEGYTIAMRGAASKDSFKRFLAALALGSIGRSDEQPTLAKLLKDRSAAVQIAAAEAILQLQG
jgi:HEAT repeat protein